MHLDKICAKSGPNAPSCANFWGGSDRHFGIGGLDEPNGVFNAAQSRAFKGDFTLRADDTTGSFNLTFNDLPRNRGLTDLGYGPGSFNGSTIYQEGGCKLVVNERPAAGDPSHGVDEQDNDDKKSDKKEK
ncbi:MAG: hypothetical protein Kow0031_27000 [Anaerolineae bacterium]